MRSLSSGTIENGHFDALDNAWQKTAFKLTLNHCENPGHLHNLARKIATVMAKRLAQEAPTQ
jgi:hypothetical protein